MSQRETQGDLFRRALVQSTRALAGKEELEVTFGAEGPRMTQGRIVLPHPPRHLNTEEAARIRGAADGLALRLAYHDDAQHKAVSPPGANAREPIIYDGLAPGVTPFDQDFSTIDPVVARPAKASCALATSPSGQRCDNGILKSPFSTALNRRFAICS